MVLDRIKKVNDIKQLNEEELAELQEEIRDFLVENIAKTSGERYPPFSVEKCQSYRRTSGIESGCD